MLGSPRSGSARTFGPRPRSGQFVDRLFAVRVAIGRPFGPDCRLFDLNPPALLVLDLAQLDALQRRQKLHANWPWLLGRILVTDFLALGLHGD